MTRLESQKIEVPEDIEDVYEFICERGWGDGLPVIPPTVERVQKALEYVGRDPQEVIGRIAPSDAEATVEKIAINAVMAGCLPAYLPVVIAAVEALVQPEFNLIALQTTTNPASPLVIVNGPVRKALNINCGANCMGQGWRANATIGRAVRLVMVNIGGAVPGTVSKAVHGMPGRYTFCFGEDEENSPWEPLHVERGFGREVSTVTVAGVQATHNVATVTRSWQSWIELISNSMVTKGNNNMFFARGGQPMVVLTSTHASELSKAGMSKSDAKKQIFEQAFVNESDFGAEILNRAYDKVVEGGKVRPCQSADDIMVVVAGSPNPLHAVVMPTFGSQTKAVTRAIVSKG